MNKYIIEYIDFDDLIYSMKKVPGKKDTYIVTPEDFNQNISRLGIYGNSKDEVMFKFLSKLPSNRYMYIGMGYVIHDWFWATKFLSAEVVVEKASSNRIRVKNDNGFLMFTSIKQRRMNLPKNTTLYLQAHE